MKENFQGHIKSRTKKAIPTTQIKNGSPPQTETKEIAVTY